MIYRMKVFPFFVLLSISSVAASSEVTNAKISRLMMDNNYGPKLFVQVEGSPERASGHCHTNPTWDYVISTDDEFGKQMHSQLLAAFVSSKNVKLVGLDECVVNGTLEGLRRIEVY